MSRTIASLLRFHESARGDEIFLVVEDHEAWAREVTYGEMHMRAQKAASVLAELGLRRGDAFNVHLPNCLQFLDLWFGASLIGAVMVPTNPVSTPHELAYVLSHARCKAVFTDQAGLGAVAEVRDRAGLGHVVTVGRGVEGADGALDELLEAAPATAGDRSVDRTAPAGVLYTSGTTSRPKGVVVTNENYIFVGEVVAQQLRLRPDDRHLVVLPLFHGNAQYYSVMSALVTGASVALMPRFSASAWARQARDHGATVASLFAAPIRMLLAQPESPTDGDNLLRVAMFAQNVTPAQAREFERRFSCPLLQLYGMTETIAPPTMNPIHGERRPESMGVPGVHAPVRIVDEGGNDVPVGAAGELLVSGRPGISLLAGYLNDDEATRRVLKDGWLHTGDTVRADSDGYLYFVDRKKDLIKRAGESISASEIEQVLNDHPAVFESAVVGVPDELRDEAIHAFVVLLCGLSTTAEELVSWCADRLAPFKVPERIEIIPELPRTAVGKVQKHLLTRSSRPFR